MNETVYSIDSADGLITFIKTVDSSVKIQKKGAEIILNSLSGHQVQLLADKDAKLYMSVKDKETEETTIDDLVDLVCEYNYEEIYETEESVKEESDFVNKCRLEKRLEELRREKQILDKIFYHTKYGRKVGVVADRICAGLCEKLCLVPIYNVPMHEDKFVSEEPAYGSATKTEQAENLTEKQDHKMQEDVPEEETISDGHIVASDAVDMKQESLLEEKEETKGAR